MTFILSFVARLQGTTTALKLRNFLVQLTDCGHGLYAFSSHFYFKAGEVCTEINLSHNQL